MTDRRPSMAELSVTEFTAGDRVGGADARWRERCGGGRRPGGEPHRAWWRRLSRAGPGTRRYAELHAEAVAAADAARSRFLQLADEDAAAYAAYRDARRLPHAVGVGDVSARGRVSSAARGATTVPLAVVQECHRLVEIAERLVGRSNTSAASDLDVAALLLECGRAGCRGQRARQPAGRG